MNQPGIARVDAPGPAATVRRSYTLVELIIVMAVLALAAAILIPNFVGSNAMRAQAAVRLIIADLSFAQTDALATQGFRRVVFYADGSGYCIIEVPSADFATPVNLDAYPDYVYDPLGTMGRYIVNFSADKRFEGVFISSATLDTIDLVDRPEITYDALGGTIQLDGTPGVGGSVTVSYGDENYRLDIAGFTGKLTVTEL